MKRLLLVAELEIHPATVTIACPWSWTRETPLDRCQDPVSNYAHSSVTRFSLYPLVLTRGAHLQERRDFVADRTGHSRNKLDRYTVLQSCLEFNRDTISCASSPTGPRHLLIRESVAWQWLFRWFITVPRDMSAGQFPRRSRGNVFIGKNLWISSSLPVCMDGGHDFIKLFASCNFTLDRSSKPAYRGSFLLG